MTVFDASQNLYQWFSKNDVFKASQLKEVILITDDAEADEAAVRAALYEFEQLDLVRYTKTNSGEAYWVLKKPFELMSQSVTISANTANTIGQLINSVYTREDEKDYLCDALNVSEKDVKNLLLICYRLLREEKD